MKEWGHNLRGLDKIIVKLHLSRTETPKTSNYHIFPNYVRIINTQNKNPKIVHNPDFSLNQQRKIKLFSVPFLDYISHLILNSSKLPPTV